MDRDNMTEDDFYNMETEHNSCFVVCIEEYDDISIDTRIFISYNVDDDIYVVNGKRNDLVKEPYFQPFMFTFEKSNDVMDFLDIIFNTNRKFSYTLFNYNNLSYNIDDITYDFMEKNMDRRYEISAFDNAKYSRHLFRKLVQMTKSAYTPIMVDPDYDEIEY